MKKTLLPLLAFSLLFSCKPQEKVDTIVINAHTYTVNSNFDTTESFAVKNGKFVALGTNKEIQEKYNATNLIDAKNKPVFPGFIDAHCHFYGLGLQQQKADLVGTESYNEVLQRLIDFQKEKNTTYITGRGWDQNDWEVKVFPTKEKLDKLFPNTPVAIRRVDGHALFVNEAALKYSGLSSRKFPKKISGGEFIQKNGKLTGVLIDAAMNYIKIPNPTKKEEIQGLLDAQKVTFSYGLTTVNDAGVSKSTINLMDS